MERRKEEVHLGDVEARSGSTPGIVRYILLISLVLVILGFSAVWLTGVLTTPETGGHADTERAVAEQRDEPQQP
ncbi:MULTISPECIES: hypothetical protein [Novosphingobium]|jgi:uncharacterized membrane protein|uniref:Uncharacterized protein n=1 Tax=Novosphingobium panipatense TaxID=428991 RepID=A0ABY1Q9G0_9SPHN|nr:MULTISPECIES: hypothetical protein [Novosphingobium]SMP61841.1 hypothetical protein SAMN06296065_103332 [Novosphingobium panipatense]